MKDIFLSEKRNIKKYGHWNGEPGYYSHSRVFQNNYHTEIRSSPSSTEVDEDAKEEDNLLLKSVQISSWQRERNRSQVVRKQNSALDQSSAEGNLLL
jgi:hypothetical protein